MQNNTFTFNKTTYIINRTDRFDYEMSTSMAFDGENVIFSYAQGTGIFKSYKSYIHVLKSI